MDLRQRVIEKGHTATELDNCAVDPDQRVLRIALICQKGPGQSRLHPADVRDVVQPIHCFPI